MAFATVLCYEDEEAGSKNKSSIARRQLKQSDTNEARKSGKSTDDVDLKITMDNIEKTWDDAKDVALEAWKEAQEVGRVLTRVIKDVGSDAVDRYVDKVDEDDDIADKAKVLGAVVARSAIEVKDQMKDHLQFTEEQEKALEQTLTSAKKTLGSAKDQAARMASDAKATLNETRQEWKNHGIVDNVKRTTSDAAEFVQDKGQQAMRATNEMLRDNDMDDIQTTARKAKDAAYEKGEELQQRTQQYLDDRDLGDVKSAARKAKDSALEKGAQLKDRTQEFFQDHDMGDVKHAARRTKNYAYEKGQQLKDGTDEFLRDHDMDDTSTAASKARDAAYEKAHDIREGAGEQGHQLWRKTKRGLSSGKEKAKELAADAQIKAEDTADNIKETTTQWWYSDGNSSSDSDHASRDEDDEGLTDKAARGARYAKDKAGDALEAASSKARELFGSGTTDAASKRDSAANDTWWSRMEDEKRFK